MKTSLTLTKYLNSFIGNDGNPVNFEFCEIEFAPNTYATFKLNQSNMRALQKYAPNMYQLLTNIPHGTPIVYKEVAPSHDIDDIYSAQAEENQL